MLLSLARSHYNPWHSPSTASRSSFAFPFKTLFLGDTSYHMITILLLSFETGFLCPETSSRDQADLEPASLLLARIRGAPPLLSN